MEDNTPEEAELITVLPFWTVRMSQGEECRYPVLLFRSYGNPCEHRGDRERCDESGSYYGSEQGNAAGIIKLCPRHWYGIHFDPHPVYHLLDMTREEHCVEIGQVARERWAAVSRVVELLHKEGEQLSRLGFGKEAGRLWETAGAIRVMAQQSPGV